MALIQTLAMLAAGAGAYKGKQRELSREAEEDAQRRRDREFTNKSRTRQEKSWEREDGIQAALQQGAAPIQPVPDLAPDQMGPPALMVQGKAYGTPEAANAAAAPLNTPQATTRRMADAVQGLDPERATRMRGEADAGELRGLQLEQTRGAITREEGIRQIGMVLARRGVQAIPELALKYQGVKVSVEPGKDGKSFTVIQLDAQGKEVERHPYEDMEQFFATVAANYDPSLLAADRAQRATTARADARYDREQTRLEGESRTRAAREERIARAAEEGLRLQREALERQAGASGPIWDKDADTFIRRAATVEDPITGQTRVDGSAMEFLKIIALAEAARTGGDTTVAIGRAIARDQRLQQEAGGDPAKLAQARAALVAQLMGQSGAPAPAAPSAAPARPAAGPTPAPQATFTPMQLAMFEKMDDAELQKYIRAGNKTAIEVARRRQPAAAPTMGFTQF
jgi:hypothetical protein